MEMMLVKNEDGTFSPATDVDYSESSKIKKGQAVRVEMKRVSQRSLIHHRKYWAGLLPLIAQHWDPKEGFLASHERTFMKSFIKWLNIQDIGPEAVEAVSELLKYYVQHVTNKRADKLPPAEIGKDALHEWMKIRVGHYDLIRTPEGLQYKPRSINFNAMNQDQFNEFWKRAVNVAWRFVLSRTFKDENEVNNAVNELLNISD